MMRKKLKLPFVVVQSLSHVQFFCNPTGCSPPGSSVHGIFHARILEWAAISFSWGSFQPRDQTFISCKDRYKINTQNQFYAFMPKTLRKLNLLKDNIWGVELGIGINTYTLLYVKQITNKRSIVQHKELYSIFCNHMREKNLKRNIYMNNFSVHLKLT